MNIFTHAGIFHGDDAIAVAMARILYPEASIVRIREYDSTLVSEGDIVLDIGCGLYDHHQENPPKMPNGVTHCAATLFWERNSTAIIKRIADNLNIRYLVDDEVCAAVHKFISMAYLNGVALRDNGEKDPAGYLTLSGVVSLFNPTWDEKRSDEDQMTQFIKMSEVCQMVLTRAIETGIKNNSTEVMRIFHKAMASSKNHIMVLDQYIPFDSLVDPNVIFLVVHPSIRGGYTLRATKGHNLPTAWRGKPVSRLQEIAPGCTFCHPTGFMAAFSTKDAAIKAAHELMLATVKQ